MANKHLKRVCGKPPPEMELEVQWQDHDHGTYLLVVRVWEDGMGGAPWEYVERCELALTEYGFNCPPRNAARFAGEFLKLR